MIIQVPDGYVTSCVMFVFDTGVLKAQDKTKLRKQSFNIQTNQSTKMASQDGG